MAACGRIQAMPRFKPGAIFGEHLIGQTARSKVHSSDSPILGVRLHRWLGVVVVVVTGLLFVRLVSLQLIQGGRLRVLANENRIKQIKLTAPRGQIWDRNGHLLADNRQVVTVDASGLTTEGWERLYPLGVATAHVIGYVSEVDQDEVGLLGQGQDKYRLQDLTGRGGLEQQYESKLRGKDGGRLVEVDSQGSPVREMGKRLAIPGIAVTTTLDAALQTAAYQALAGRKGAVVATNPKTGEVLVLTSSPSFDPTDIADQIKQTDLPFLNRAVGGIYAPGSVFKMTTIIAALAEDKLDKNFTFTDTGAITIGSFAYTNWFFTQYGRVEGQVGWVKALTRSTDTFFYKVGENAGPDLLAKWAHTLGLGEKTNIDIPGEVGGLIPTPAWKEQVKKEKWFLGNTYHMAIGQADILVTPLQVNVMTSILATRGDKCQPNLIKDQPGFPKCPHLILHEDIWNIVTQGMVGACSSGGTAFPLFNFVPQVACKTGTAEYVRPDGKIGTHAWLTAFAPADDPTIAITALVEGGGEGSRAAAPIVRQVLTKYFGIVDNYNYAAISGVGE